jgi:hypothetical protein
MRRLAAILLLSALSAAVAALTPVAAIAQSRPRRSPEPVSRPAGPPHAWLFGTWTGGLFPVLDGMVEQDCHTQPTVVFAQDVVGHASLTGTGLTRRVIETVRTTPAGAEFRFAPDAEDTGAFGCEDTNELHVARETNNTINFPHCAGFPYPLERCPTPGR